LIDRKNRLAKMLARGDCPDGFWKWAKAAPLKLLGRVLINAQTVEGPLSGTNRKTFAQSGLTSFDP